MAFQYLDQGSFFVTLRSDHSLEYHDNTSVNFTNVLYKPLRLPDNSYQVALSEIFMEESVYVKPTSDEFFLPGVDNNIKVWDYTGTFTQFPKNTNDLSTWMERLTETYGILSLLTTETSLKLELVKDLATGEDKAKLTFVDPNDTYVLEFSPRKYADMLGFTNSTFSRGDHVSENPIDYSKFNEIPVNDKIKVICINKTPVLIPISQPSTKTVSALIAKIVVAFAKNKIKVRMPRVREGHIVVHLDQKNTKFQLPPVVNQALGLADDFIFENPVTEIKVAQNNLVEISNQVLVETSIITEQYYGSKCRNILRIFPRPTKGVHHFNFKPLFFCDLNSTEIKEININLTAENHRLLSPAETPTTVVLLFRRKSF